VHIPRGFHDHTDWDHGRACQYLVKASIGALRNANLQPAPDAAGRLGTAIKDAGVDRRELVRLLEGTLTLAGTDDPEWGSLAAHDGSAVA
jgi:hypothetical protein